MAKNAYEAALANPESALSKFVAQRENVVTPAITRLRNALRVLERLGDAEFLGAASRELAQKEALDAARLLGADC
jgi:hypothetical protein